jgi:transcriptional regulator with XRE-family HTH domain
MLPVQCKMARVATGLGVRDLAELAKVSPDTVARLERGEPLKERTVDAIRRALEDAGVIFVAENGEGPGVRLKKERPQMQDSDFRAEVVEELKHRAKGDGHASLAEYALARGSTEEQMVEQALKNSSAIKIDPLDDNE